MYNYVCIYFNEPKIIKVINVEIVSSNWVAWKCAYFFVRSSFAQTHFKWENDSVSAEQNWWPRIFFTQKMLEENVIFF